VEVRVLLWDLHMALSLLIFLLFGRGIIVCWPVHRCDEYRLARLSLSLGRLCGMGFLA